MKHKKPSRYFTALALAGVFGIIGTAWLLVAHAATYATAAELEAATISGNAAPATNTFASSGSALQFGDLPQLPSEIRTITGGTSIALVWRASPSTDVQGYEVYRDNVKVATVKPGSGTVQMELEGRRYIDTNVTRGQTYSYRLRVIGGNGQVSALSTAISARHPTSTTPTPAVSFEYVRAAAPANKAFVEATIRNELAIWYPKISDTLAYPSYTPSTSIIIETNPDVLLGRAGNRIGYDPTQMTAANIPDLLGGGLLHEATHMVADISGKTMPGWLGEGIADWTRDDLTLERTPYYLEPGYQFADLSYASGASYIRYIEQTYRASFARDISQAVRNNQYSSSYVTNLIGKSETQLFTEQKARYAGVSGMVTGPGGKCVTVAGSTVTNGTRLTLSTCANSNAQKWTPYFENPANKNPANGGIMGINGLSLGVSKCVDVSGSGTANNSIVQFWSCNATTAQQWYVGQNGSLVNANAGKCLAPLNNATADGTQLVITTCDGTANQRWTVPS